MAKKVIYELLNPEEGKMNHLNPLRFEKELLREGEWIHPEKKFRIKVTRERMANWIGKFNEMRACDLNIAVLHRGFRIASWLEELRVADGSLIGNFKIERSKDAGLFKGVVVALNPDFIDQIGRHWGEVIDHIDISALSGAEEKSSRVVSSEDGEKIEILRFAAMSECPNSGMSVVHSLRRQVLKSLNRNIARGFGCTPLVVEGQVLNAQGDIEVVVKDGSWHRFLISKGQRAEIHEE